MKEMNRLFVPSTRLKTLLGSSVAAGVLSLATIAPASARHGEAGARAGVRLKTAPLPSPCRPTDPNCDPDANHGVSLRRLNRFFTPSTRTKALLSSSVAAGVLSLATIAPSCAPQGEAGPRAGVLLKTAPVQSPCKPADPTCDPDPNHGVSLYRGRCSSRSAPAMAALRTA
jgi:hypothetical protein